MKMFDDLFAFPIVMVDGLNEESKIKEKEKYGTDDQPVDADIIVGEQECPYYDFVSVGDRWVPTQRSFDNALQGKFNHCYVIFANSGSFVVPWSKKRFKEELRKFVETVPKPKATITEIELTPEQIEQIHLLVGDRGEEEEHGD